MGPNSVYMDRDPPVAFNTRVSLILQYFILGYKILQNGKYNLQVLEKVHLTLNSSFGKQRKEIVNPLCDPSLCSHGVYMINESGLTVIVNKTFIIRVLVNVKLSPLLCTHSFQGKNKQT